MVQALIEKQAEERGFDVHFEEWDGSEEAEREKTAKSWWKPWKQYLRAFEDMDLQE